MSAPDQDDGESGFSLFVVLAFLMLAAGIITPFLLNARSYSLILRNVSHEQRGRLAVESLSLVAAQRYLELIEQERTVPNQLACEFDDDGQAFGLSFVNHSGLIDLNAAPIGLLQHGFAALGATDDAALELANTVDRYRGPDLDPSAAGTVPVVGGLKHMVFENIAELSDFQSPVTGDLWRLQQVFSVNSPSGVVDRQQAPPALAAKLGNTDFIVEAAEQFPALSVEVHLRIRPGVQVHSLGVFVIGDQQRMRRSGPLLLETVEDRGEFRLSTEDCAQFFDAGSLLAIRGLLQ